MDGATIRHSIMSCRAGARWSRPSASTRGKVVSAGVARLARRARRGLASASPNGGDDLGQHRERIVLGLDASRSLRPLREALGALPPILNSGSPTGALCRRRARLELAALLGPFRPLRVRHLANHELPRGNLLAHVLELRLPCLVISFPTRLRHLRSLPFTSSARQKHAANPAILLTNTIGVGELGVTSRFAPHVIPRHSRYTQPAQPCGFRTNTRVEVGRPPGLEHPCK